MDTLMWEARAIVGRGEELSAWVHHDVAPELRTRPGVERVEVFTSSAEKSGDERVVLIVVGAPGALPSPPEALVARAPRTWWFRRLEPS